VADFGFDIADYENPVFGTMAEFDALLDAGSSPSLPPDGCSTVSPPSGRGHLRNLPAGRAFFQQQSWGFARYAAHANHKSAQKLRDFRRTLSGYHSDPNGCADRKPRNRSRAEAMNLQVYRKKRNFDVTPEPRGRTGRAKGGRYVIQKHAARRLHYDFRIEFDGVMKSWAVTRGPSLVPGEKRLAIHVEDHPIEYNSFEGTIPEGQYGGGTVMIWDRGHWYPEGDPHKGYAEGRLTFVLDGEKLKGRWHLIRMRARANQRQDPWLLIKAEDDVARRPGEEDVLAEQPLSVVSGRSLEEIAEGRGGRKRVWQSNRSTGRAKPAAPRKKKSTKVKRAAAGA
jgi:DNA ligase D-like protein (predicted 3'-phosphoesterase)